jgi:transcriptional regulator with XRE-family HTH domain
MPEGGMRFPDRMRCPVTNDDPAILRRRLRVELKKARHAAGMTQRDVAEELDWSPSKIIRIESGSVSVSTTDLKALLDCYRVTDQGVVEDLTRMARGAKRPDRWAAYKDLMSPEGVRFLGYESSASVIQSCQILVVPGLLQTEEYASAFLRDAHRKSVAEIDDLVKLRAVRQELLERQNPPEMTFLIDEAAIRRVVGGPSVMKRQLRHLVEVNQLPHVTVQIVPFPNGAHPGMRGPFVYMEFPLEEDGDVVFLEGAEDRILHDDPEDVARYAEYFLDIQNKAASGDELESYVETAIEKLPSGR